MALAISIMGAVRVALRKESVDRNYGAIYKRHNACPSLSARRAWIEILNVARRWNLDASLSARRAWIEIVLRPDRRVHGFGRSPQGERG